MPIGYAGVRSCLLHAASYVSSKSRRATLHLQQVRAEINTVQQARPDPGAVIRIPTLWAWVTLVALVFATTPAHALLPIQDWKTSSGARVLFVENHDLPMLDVSVDFPAGSGHDTKAKAGRAAFTHELLKLGTLGA